MSKYTTEVRFLCESLSGQIEQVGYNGIDLIITTAAPQIFDFDFPIFDEDYRLPLEKKILRHYYTREISEETVGLWKLRLEDKLNMIMPYYNQLYASELIEFNPLHDTEVTTDSTTTGSGSTQNNTTGGSTTEYEEGTNDDTIKNSETIYSDETSGYTLKEYEKNLSGKKTDDTTNTNTKTTDMSNTLEIDETVKHTGSVTDTDQSGFSENFNSSNTQANGTHANNSNKDAYSETPQGTLSGVEELNYLTTARIITEDNTTTTNNSDEFGSLLTHNNAGTITHENQLSDTTTGTDKTIDKGTITDKLEIDGTQTVKNEDTGKSDETTSGSKDSTTTTAEGISSTGNKSSTSTVTNTGSNIGSTSSTEEYIQNITGKRSLSSFSKYLIEFRQTFLNIDNMIINELSDLFINLW